MCNLYSQTRAVEAVAAIMRLEIASAIRSECAALINLCEREARWTATDPIKNVLQRIESFAKARMPPPSFFDAFR